MIWWPNKTKESLAMNIMSPYSRNLGFTVTVDMTYSTDMVQKSSDMQLAWD